MVLTEETKQEMERYKKHFIPYGCTDDDFVLEKTKKGFYHFHCTKDLEDPPKIGLPFVFDEKGNQLLGWDAIFDALDPEVEKDPTDDIIFDEVVLGSKWVQEKEENGQLFWYLKKGAPAKIVRRYRKFIEHLYRDDDGGNPNYKELIDRLMKTRVD